MLKGPKSVNLKIIQMYHFRLKWKKIYGMHKLVGLQLFLSGNPTFSSGTPTFCQMGVLNSCFQNPSESSGWFKNYIFAEKCILISFFYFQIHVLLLLFLHTYGA